MSPFPWFTFCCWLLGSVIGGYVGCWLYAWCTGRRAARATKKLTVATGVVFSALRLR
jgi:hypothetical protein